VVKIVRGLLGSLWSPLPKPEVDEWELSVETAMEVCMQYDWSMEPVDPEREPRPCSSQSAEVKVSKRVTVWEEVEERV